MQIIVGTYHLLKKLTLRQSEKGNTYVKIQPGDYTVIAHCKHIGAPISHLTARFHGTTCEDYNEKAIDKAGIEQENNASQEAEIQTAFPKEKTQGTLEIDDKILTPKLTWLPPVEGIVIKGYLDNKEPQHAYLPVQNRLAITIGPDGEMHTEYGSSMEEAERKLQAKINNIAEQRQEARVNASR